eukprot:5115466-Prymnesium_polylepis.1
MELRKKSRRPFNKAFLVERLEVSRRAKRVADIFTVFTSKITRTCRDAGWWTALQFRIADRVMRCSWVVLTLLQVIPMGGRNAARTTRTV